MSGTFRKNLGMGKQVVGAHPTYATLTINCHFDVFFGFYSRLHGTLRVYALDIPFVRLDLTCHQYHPSQLLVPHLHEFPALVQHWNDPEEMRPAHPLNQIYLYSLRFRFLSEEDCFLVSWVLSRSSNVDWWKKLDVWMEQRRVKWIVNPRRSVPYYQPR